MGKCAWASIDENGNSKGGQAGNQTGKELRVGNWYQFGQSVVYRFKDRKQAEQLAELMKDACNNMNIGYNQAKRSEERRVGKEC